VMRNFGDYKELRRLKLFDKTIDAAACSPYTTGVQSWILAGLGSGARIAATCCSRVKVPISGLVLLSYPLFEATPPMGRGGGQPDSTKQIVSTMVPTLFVHGGRDRTCRAEDLIAFCGQCAASSEDRSTGACGARVVVLQDVDSSFALHASGGRRAGDGRNAVEQV
jgi:hypothetical protein